ncbi:thioesterase II family protein [Streptomyces violaceus]|uniref:Thioesterase domain-containing protein n=2 Tax=Streptomyces violaceus TaxID=1936 RepID=A0ABY9U9R4_STRVL|nr:thioesterase [Streptomyces janthinus]WND19638.1 thioesterase domain-containing protein [Streptomyces janthinus]
MDISNYAGISKQSSKLVPWSTGTTTRSGNSTALACIPWAGAGATPFRPWGPVIDDVADVYGVRLAGRESRQTEPLPTSLDQVVDELVAELVALDVPRVALFGQCSGALLAYRTAQRLHRSGEGPEVAHLLVASQLPPRVLADGGDDSGEDLTRYVPEHLREEPELLEVLLPILAADMRLVSDYVYTPDAPLDVPLTVLYGAGDDLLSRAEVDGWRHETTGPSAFREVAGADHLFGGTAWLELAEAIRTALT